jgi:hypothetical protein
MSKPADPFLSQYNDAATVGTTPTLSILLIDRQLVIKSQIPTSDPQRYARVGDRSYLRRSSWLPQVSRNLNILLFTHLAIYFRGFIVDAVTLLV